MNNEITREKMIIYPLLTQIFARVLEKIFARKLDELYPHAKFEQLLSVRLRDPGNIRDIHYILKFYRFCWSGARLGPYPCSRYCLIGYTRTTQWRLVPTTRRARISKLFLCNVVNINFRLEIFLAVFHFLFILCFQLPWIFATSIHRMSQYD